MGGQPGISCQCIINERTNKLTCFFMLIKGENAEISFIDKIRILWLTLFQFGFEPFKRILSCLTFFEDEHQKHLQPIVNSSKKENYYSFNRFATHVDWQGQGLGTKVMTALMKKIDDEKKVIVLDTQMSRTMEFYKRFGFRLIHESQYKDVTSYCMVR